MTSNHNSRVPQAREMLNPTLSAIRNLGDSARNDEITEQVIGLMNIPESVAEIPHKDGGRSQLEYRLAWARTLLKAYGVIDNSQRGVWRLTSAGLKTQLVDPSVVRAEYRRLRRVRASKGENGESTETEDDDFLTDASEVWRELLLSQLLKMSPNGFERLCRLLLRESGFIEVDVTGRPGDGGIDGNGIIRLGNLISFPVSFQCKRYSRNVPARDVRDFRGAMQGRAEKGLIITTGGFTPAAKEEAKRDGAPPIDLIDGEALLDLLKGLRLGVKVTERVVEDVEVDVGFFAAK